MTADYLNAHGAADQSFTLIPQVRSRGIKRLIWNVTPDMT